MALRMRFLAAHLVAPEWHVADGQAVLACLCHGPCVVNHLFKGDGQCVVVSAYDVRGGIADEYAVDACCVEDGRCGVVVGCHLRYFLPGGFHFDERFGSDFLLVGC